MIYDVTKRCYFCSRTEKEIIEDDEYRIFDKGHVFKSDGDKHLLLPLTCNFCYKVFSLKLKEEVLIFRCPDCGEYVSVMSRGFPYPKWVCMGCGLNFELVVKRNEPVRCGSFFKRSKQKHKVNR